MTDPAPVSAGESCDAHPEPAQPDEDGWVRRTVTDRGRVEELIAMYRGYGFETRVVALGADRFAEGCRACILSAGACVALFTRPAGPAGDRSP